MPISLHAASTPLFTSMLSNLMHMLDKADQFVVAKKIDPTALTGYRLAPDMLPFNRQIMIACDAAKNGVARMAGVTAPKFDDTETSFADLKARVQKTLDFLATVSPEQLNGREDQDVVWPIGQDKTMTMSAHTALQRMALPNFFFHISMAYAILRHNGVELGKRDFLMGAAAPAPAPVAG
jgi:uncharacterized protein